MHIVTARLILREFLFDDWPAVLEYQRDPRYLRFYPWNDRTDAEVQGFVQMFLDQQAEQPRRKFQLAITLPSDSGRVKAVSAPRPVFLSRRSCIGCAIAASNLSRQCDSPRREGLYHRE
jgi:RimJ/RimL family protein N-acetyltransferase